MEYEISNSEVGRRQVIMGNLKKSLNLLNSQNSSMSSSPVTMNSISPGTTPPNMKGVHRISGSSLFHFLTYLLTYSPTHS